MKKNYNLKRFDALGTIVGFRVDGHNRKRSRTGGFMTVLLLITSLAVLGFFGDTYINKKETYQKNLINTFDDGQYLDLQKSHFHYGIKFDHRNIKAYQDAYEIDVSWVKYNLTAKKLISKERLSVIECDKSKWIGTFEEYDLLEIDNTTCFDNHNVHLYGNSHYGVLSKMELSLLVKDHAMRNKTLIKEIYELEKHNPPFLNFYFYNTMFSSNDGHSVDHFIDKYTYEVHIDSYLIADVYLSKDQMVEINDQLLVTSEDVKSEYRTHKSNIITKTRKEIENHNMKIQIISDTKRNVTIYSSLTFSETVARIGGIINIVLLICQVVVYVKNYLDFEYEITRKYFHKVNDDINIEYYPNKNWVGNEKNSKCNEIEEPQKKEKKQIFLLKKKFKDIKENTDNINNQIHKSDDTGTNIPDIKMIKNNLNTLNLDTSFVERKDSIKNSANDSQNRRVINQRNNLNLLNNTGKYSLKFNNNQENNNDFDKLSDRPNSNIIIEKTNKKLKKMKKLTKYVKNNTLPEKIKNINFCEWALLKYCPFIIPTKALKLQTKVLIYNKIEEYLNKALNVPNIEKRYMDLELLKIILLDKQQLKAFQNISFSRAVMDIKKHEQYSDPSDIDNNKNTIDPKLTSSLVQLYERQNLMDNKIRKYYK